MPVRECPKCLQVNEFEVADLILGCAFCSFVFIQWTPVAYHETPMQPDGLLIDIHALDFQYLPPYGAWIHMSAEQKRLLAQAEPDERRRTQALREMIFTQYYETLGRQLS